MGRCEPATGIRPITAPVDQVMQAEPYASARRVFWVVDNGASHRNWAAAARLSDAYPNTQMVHLPVHASWHASGSTTGTHRTRWRHETPAN
jgi:hypothetical protein